MRISFTGDILCYRSQIAGCRTGEGRYDFSPVFSKVKPLFEGSDYVVGSLETTVAGRAAGYSKNDVCFNTPDELLYALKDVGVNLLTTANNHCFDRGEEGLVRTMSAITQSGMSYTGTRLSANEEQYLLVDLKGTKVAFLAYTYGTNSVSNGFVVPHGKEYLVNLTRPQDRPVRRPWYKKLILSIMPASLRRSRHSAVIKDCVRSAELQNGRNDIYEKAMLEALAKARSEADLVFVCLHSGGQFNSSVGEYTEHLFNLLAGNGADAIVCNHAHTVLPVRKIGKCVVASALGNFSFAPHEGNYVDGVLADYSILLHADIEGKVISRLSFSICKCVKDRTGLAVTVPVSSVAGGQCGDLLAEDLHALMGRIASVPVDNEGVKDYYDIRFCD